MEGLQNPNYEHISKTLEEGRSWSRNKHVGKYDEKVFNSIQTMVGIVLGTIRHILGIVQTKLAIGTTQLDQVHFFSKNLWYYKIFNIRNQWCSLES